MVKARAKRLGDPRRWISPARRLAILSCALAALYLGWRVDSLRLPEGCSPLHRLAPGTRVWIDRRPPRYHAGDVAFFEGADGRLHFGEVAELRARPAGGVECRILNDDPRCPAPDSRTLGWIGPDRLRGRLIFALAER